MGDKRIIASRGINWTWFIGATFNDAERTATLHFHERWHHGDPWPAALGEAVTTGHYAEYHLLEDNKREAYGIAVSQYVLSDRGAFQFRGIVEYLLLNPANVFSYKDFHQLKETQ